MTGYHSGHFVREGLAGTNIPVKQKILTTQEMLQKAGYVTAGVGKMAPLSSPTAQVRGTTRNQALVRARAYGNVVDARVCTLFLRRITPPAWFENLSGFRLFYWSS